jgi:hypothetical protein
MRSLCFEEVSAVSGGELECAVTVSKDASVTCSGGLSDWIMAGRFVWTCLEASPFTVPGILARIS